MDPITFTLLAGLALGHLVFLFTTTNFIVEYAHLFRLDRWFLVKEYHQWLDEKNLDYGYHIFLRERYPNSFWAKLLGCPFCLITFIGLFILGWIGGVFFILFGFAIATLATLTFLVEKLLYKKNFE